MLFLIKVIFILLLVICEAILGHDLYKKFQEIGFFQFFKSQISTFLIWVIGIIFVLYLIF